MPEKGYAAHWRIVQVLGKQRYLLLSLASLLVLLPLLTETGTSRLWLTAVLTLIMIAGPLTLATRRFDLYLSLILGSVMTATTWIDIIFELVPIGLIGRIATVVFFIMLAGLIFRQYLFERNQVNSETLIAAVNAYLCIGITYAFAYSFLMTANPTSFSGTFMENPDFNDFVYLSFVTMTTLGYGDITPNTEIAGVLTYTQAIIGQLYMALTVARIVGIMAAQKSA
jgi:hypothetical protein